ncbi:MAG: iron-containing redox enzyme family protein [Proteobacteria bacterium]|nr:iron-containing redox enzyme family protein [Pseudomonadota bacterium]
MEQIQEGFQQILETFMGCQTLTSLMEGRITTEHYKSILRQIFHHTRENPQLQALSTVYFRGRQREVIQRFYRHATSEVGHDQLALNDFKTLGGDASSIPYENPLPATLALLGYGFYEVYNRNPLGYLGYLFFLEFTPTTTGNGVMDALRAVGIPDRAMTFLKDHTVIDVGHNRLMEGYVADLVRHDWQADIVVAAMHTTGNLYANMLDEAVAFADAPYNVGWNWGELQADGLEPIQFRRRQDQKTEYELPPYDAVS